MKRRLLFFSVLYGCFGFSQKKWSLQEAVDYAKNNNLQVIQNQYTQKIQQSNLEIAKRDWLPAVSGSWSHNTNLGQQQFGSFIQRNDSYSNNINIGANIQLYNQGRIKKNIAKSELDVQASQYDIETIQNNISLQIVQLYLNTLLNKEVVKIAESALKNAQKQYDRAKITTDVGTTPKTILAEADAALAREEQNLKNAEINVKRSLFDLAQLLRLEQFNDFDIQDFSYNTPIQPPISSVDNIIETAFENQPQIKAAETRILSAEKQTEIAKTAFYPSISANAGIGSFYFNSLNNNLDKNLFLQYKNNFSQQIGLSANVPIFNKGITRLQVEQSKINEEIAKNNLEQQKQTMIQNIYRAQFDAENNFEIYKSAQKTAESTLLALDFAEKSYSAGRSTIYDVNIARNNYANAQGQVAQAKYNYLFSLKLLQFYSGIPIGVNY